MSESVTEFTVPWEQRADDRFWAIDRGTYLANVLDVNFKEIQSSDIPMAQVTLKFDEVRVTKTAPSGETVTDTAYGRELRVPFFFDGDNLDRKLQNAYNFLMASGVTTEDELNSPEARKSDFVARKFFETQGASVAVEVSQYPSKAGKEDPYADPNGMKNGANRFHAKGSRKYELAAGAAGATVDVNAGSTGGRRRKQG